MKCYKLNVLYPWWCNHFKSMVPLDHVETIVDGIKEIYGSELWEELTFRNLDWKNEGEIWAVGKYEALPDYIKMEKGNGVYYYYLYDKNEIVSEGTDGLLYRGKYLLDAYMTKYNKKLHCLIDKNPVVKFKHKYCDRFQKDSDDNWFIDFVAQKYLSSYNQQNAEKVRKVAYSTTESLLYANNFSAYAKPTNRTLTKYGTTGGSGNEWVISNFKTLLETPSNTGRYRYLVCKSSAKISTNTSKIEPVATSQTILLIPLWDDSVIHAINDINITGTQTGALSCLGENLIGFWESDLPYSFIYGMEQSDSSHITMSYAENTCYGTVSRAKIPFWELPLNYYKKFKLIDFSQYSQGFAGKMTYMIQNLDKWNPDTEPALYAPQNYQEVYNNGVGNITNDFSYFIFQWNDTSLLNLKNYQLNGTIPNDDPAFISMYCAFGFDDALNIAYDFGDFTNTKLASYDNTEVITSSVSIQNQILGSAAANYYSNNVNTGLTSVQNRKSEQDQATVDASLNTAQIVLNAVPRGLEIFNPFKIGRKTANAAMDIAKTWNDYAQEQQRANRNIANQYNNIYSSPASIVGSPYIKGVIPNDGALFKTYAYELHPFDKAKVFGDILQYGRIYDTLDELNKFDNNVYMNILDIDPYVTYYRLLRIILENDTSIFNTQKDNEEFFIWLGEAHQVFNTWYPINCINYQADNYVDNVERTVYPTGKININTVISNIPDKIPAESSLLIAKLQELNPSAPATVWNEIDIVTANFTQLTIKTKESSTLYYGSINRPCCCYNGYCEYIHPEQGYIREYFYDFNKVFCNWKPKGVWTWESGDEGGYTHTFNDPIVFNTLSSFTTIGNNFLNNIEIYNQVITIPTNISSIGDNFLIGANTFNQPFTIPASVVYLGKEFMGDTYQFCSTLTVNANPQYFSGDDDSLAAGVIDVPIYETGVTIAGTYTTEFKTKYPNSDDYPWRKLL